MHSKLKLRLACRSSCWQVGRSRFRHGAAQKLQTQIWQQALEPWVPVCLSQIRTGFPGAVSFLAGRRIFIKHKMRRFPFPLHCSEKDECAGSQSWQRITRAVTIERVTFVCLERKGQKYPGCCYSSLSPPCFDH